MSRNLTAAMIAEITARDLRPVMFIQAQFVSGYIYVWSGLGSISWNGQTWLGVGNYGNVSAISETSDVNAVGVKLQLSGIPNSILGLALNEVRQGAPVFIYQGCMTKDNKVVGTPYLAWAGRMDIGEIAEGSDTSVITITAESRLLDLNRKRERRYEKQDQAIDFPDDLGFDFVPSLQELSITWGKPGSGGIPISGAGGGSSAGGGGGSGREDTGLREF